MGTVAEGGNGKRMLVNARYSSIPQVLVIFQSDENRAELLHAIVAAGMVPKVCNHLAEVKQFSDDAAVIICEDQVAKEMFRKTLFEAQNRAIPIPVIVASRTGEWDEFLSALRDGAFDYLVLPPSIQEVRRLLLLAVRERSAARAAENTSQPGRFLSSIPSPNACESSTQEWCDTCSFRNIK